MLVVGADPSGRGFGARAHIPAVLASPQLELSAVCTTRPETAKRAAERWGAPRWYADVRAAVADPTVELVTVAVRVRSHRDIVDAALAAGKPVYCEWPLGLDVGEAAAVAARARAAGVPCGVGTQGRFSPIVVHARALVERGDIGRPLSFQASQLLSRFPVDSDRWWLAREEEGSGALQVATAHLTDTLQHLLGPVASLCGVRATLRPDDCYADTGEPFRWTASDSVAYVARLGNGIVGSAHVSNVASPAVGFSLRILGDGGQVAVLAPAYLQFTRARLLRGRAGADTLEDVVVPPAPGQTSLALSEADAGLNVALALERLAAALPGRYEFHPSFDDALQLHRVVAAIARSSDERVWVDLQAPV